MPLRLNIVGAGRVGQTLAHLWHTQGVFTVQGVACRSQASAQRACDRIGAGQPVDTLGALPPADVWMLSVPDSQIADVAAALAALQPPTPIQPAPVVFHCAGASSAEVLAPLAARGWHTASAHCILSFATVEAALAQFAGTACALEGGATACAALHTAFTAIGAQCFTVQAQDKLLYHAAAVFATNFLPVLQGLAEDAWRASGVPPALLPQLRARLLQHAVHNLTTLGPTGALTGPAARGDHAHLARQSAAVRAWNPDAAAAYDALSTLALQLAAQRTPPPQAKP